MLLCCDVLCRIVLCCIVLCCTCFKSSSSSPTRPPSKIVTSDNLVEGSRVVMIGGEPGFIMIGFVQ